MISGYDTVDRIRTLFPYLEVRWLPEFAGVGKQIVGELLGSAPRLFSELSEDLRGEVIDKAKRSIANPFSYWLTQMGEAMITELDGLPTESGVFKQFIDSG